MSRPRRGQSRARLNFHREIVWHRWRAFSDSALPSHCVLCLPTVTALPPPPLSSRRERSVGRPLSDPSPRSQIDIGGVVSLRPRRFSPTHALTHALTHARTHSRTHARGMLGCRYASMQRGSTYCAHSISWPGSSSALDVDMKIASRASEAASCGRRAGTKSTKPLASPHLTSPHITSPCLDSTSPRLTSPQPRLNLTSPRLNLASPRLNLTSRHAMSRHVTPRHRYEIEEPASQARLGAYQARLPTLRDEVAAAQERRRMQVSMHACVYACMYACMYTQTECEAGR